MYISLRIQYSYTSSTTIPVDVDPRCSARCLVMGPEEILCQEDCQQNYFRPLSVSPVATCPCSPTLDAAGILAVTVKLVNRVAQM